MDEQMMLKMQSGRCRSWLEATMAEGVVDRVTSKAERFEGSLLQSLGEEIQREDYNKHEWLGAVL
jgi:hypothetical protein